MLCTVLCRLVPVIPGSDRFSPFFVSTVLAFMIPLYGSVVVPPPTTIVVRSSLLLAAFLLFFFQSDLFAQGYAGSFLRRSDAPAEAAMSGTLNPWGASPALLFTNGAALTRMRGVGAIFSASVLTPPQKTFQTGIAAKIGTAGGIGLGVTSYSVSDIDQRLIDETSLGFTSSQELAFTLAGGMNIGPGSIGGTLRYLRYDLSGVEGGAWGVTMDISGTLAFREQFLFAVALNNIAGTMNASYRDGLHEKIPYEARLSTTYVYPLEKRTKTERPDPSGMLRVQQLQPRRYILATGELRVGEFEEPAIVGGGIEAVPIQLSGDGGVGLRAGFNSRGDLSLGFFVDTPLDLGKHPRISFATRRDYDRGEFTLHAGLEFSL